MPTIKSIKAFEIIDSRGNPTIASKVMLSDGSGAFSAVPSGASKGSGEALEIRDGDTKRLKGMGVRNAVANINGLINQNLAGSEANDQKLIDKMLIQLDGTENKSKLGGNAILSVSQAVCRAAAKSNGMTLYEYVGGLSSNSNFKMPSVLFNMIEGGLHASSGVNFQEFLIIPGSINSFQQSVEMGMTIYFTLKDALAEKDYQGHIGDEGGYVPELDSNHEGLAILKSAIEMTQYKFALDVFLGLDIAANSFFQKGAYTILDKPTPLKSNELSDFYVQLFSEFAIIYFEDPFSENDIDSFKKLTEKMSGKALVIGDDLTTTNPVRLSNVTANGAITGIIIKPNQIGTITETLAVIEMARFKKLKIIVSHRSGETNDPFIADFAVGVGADYVKFGAPARERIVKYNRLLEIANDLPPAQQTLPPQA